MDENSINRKYMQGHGNAGFEDSASETSSFDETYEKMKPPPIPYESLVNKIVRVYKEGNIINDSSNNVLNKIKENHPMKKDNLKPQDNWEYSKQNLKTKKIIHNQSQVNINQKPKEKNTSNVIIDNNSKLQDKYKKEGCGSLPKNNIKSKTNINQNSKQPITKNLLENASTSSTKNIERIKNVLISPEVSEHSNTSSKINKTLNNQPKTFEHSNASSRNNIESVTPFSKHTFGTREVSSDQRCLVQQNVNQIVIIRTLPSYSGHNNISQSSPRIDTRNQTFGGTSNEENIPCKSKCLCFTCCVIL